jgi:hypothetical protein
LSDETNEICDSLKEKKSVLTMVWSIHVGLAPRIRYLEGEVLEEEGMDLPEKPRKPARSRRLHEYLHTFCVLTEQEQRHEQQVISPLH